MQDSKITYFLFIYVNAILWGMSKVPQRCRPQLDLVSFRQVIGHGSARCITRYGALPSTRL